MGWNMTTNSNISLMVALQVLLLLALHACTAESKLLRSSPSERNLQFDLEQDVVEFGTLTYVGNNENATELGLCQGDCDQDSDCVGINTVCFERDENQDVPGCQGGLDAADDSDYCVDPSWTLAPSTAPSAAPRPVLEIVVTTGEVQKLSWCQGRCETDQDCEEGLVCYQYKYTLSATANGVGTLNYQGCELEEYFAGHMANTAAISKQELEAPAVSFCAFRYATLAPNRPPTTLAPVFTPTTASPRPQPTTQNPRPQPTTQRPGAPPTTPAPTPWPTPKATPSSQQNQPQQQDVPVLPPLRATHVGNNGGGLLNRCEADCDQDNDCASGLVCFQRSGGGDVPGCITGPNVGPNMDFCIQRGLGGAPAQPLKGFALKMYWEEGYEWQDEPHEKFYCMEHGIGQRNPPRCWDRAWERQWQQACPDWCHYGASDMKPCEPHRMYTTICNPRNANQRFAFDYLPSGEVLIRATSNDLCFKSGRPELVECDAGDKSSRWMSGATSFAGDKFEISRIGDEDRCLTPHHHPKPLEIIELKNCARERGDDTSYWEIYYG